MPYVQIQDIRLGMDRKRKSRVAAELGSAWTIENAHITRGGDIDKRKKFVRQTGSFPSTTSGLTAINETLFTFGYDASEAGNVPAGVTHILNQHPTPTTAIDKVLGATAFDGTTYSIVQYVDGNIYHFYGTGRVTDWDTIAIDVGSNNAVAAALAGAIDNSGAVSASESSNVITITAETAGTPFTITQSTTNNGVNPDQTITLNETQANVAEVTEVVATVDIEVTGGTRDAGINAVSSITIDGVDVLGASVDWDVSNSQTASDLADQINTFNSTPEYTATVSGPVLTISAAAGTGSGPNAFAVVVNEIGDVTTTHDSTMSSGVTAVTPVAQVVTATIGGTFETLDQFTITINGTENYTVTGGGAATGTSILTFKSKLYSTAASNLYFSALNAPTQWVSGVDSGFINMASQIAGQETLTAAEEYQGLMAIFSENNIRIWSISESSQANVFLQTLRNTGTVAPNSVVPYGNNDVFYLDTSGIRSIKARDSSNAAYVSDVGTNIDTHIREYMDTLTEEDIASATGVVEPVDGRFWIGLKNRIYVLSYFPTGKISGWSFYTVDFDIVELVRAGDRIYARGTEDGVDYLYLYGGENNDDYGLDDEIVVNIELPYVTARNPAAFKELLGFDIIAINSWEVQTLPDPARPEVVKDEGTTDGTTYGEPKFGVTGVTPLFGINLVCRKAGQATLSALAMHYSGNFEDG